MARLVNLSDCTGCSACAAVCPKGCITMFPDAWGFLYPNIDAEQCVNCGLCNNVCPLDVTRLEKQETEAYSVCNLNDSVRINSSSGGTFTILAEHVIKNGGVVFGAGFDKKWNVEHTFVENIADISKFRGAKYAQSKIGNTYEKTKEFLLKGRLVLFSGTPCQIGGLKAYLGKDYENLICQDVICHGVPAPGIWQQYLKEREKKAGSPIQNISFRCKKRGWKNYLVSINFKNGKTYQNPPALDPYMRAFLSDLSLRPSCFNCKYKELHRQADITLADFWGIEYVLPEMDDDKGTSLVLIHSEKGKKLLRLIQKNATVTLVDTEKAIRFNPSAIQSARKPTNYAHFMKDMSTGNFIATLARYHKIPTKIKIKLEIRELLQKLQNNKVKPR